MEGVVKITHFVTSNGYIVLIQDQLNIIHKLVLVKMNLHEQNVLRNDQTLVDVVDLCLFKRGNWVCWLSILNIYYFL